MKKIYIRRKEQNGYLPKEVLATARVTIGSIFVGRQPLKGFNEEEEKKYLRTLIDVPPDHQDWPRLVKEFWANMRLRIPFEGVELDVTVDDDGMPLNPTDYASYRWCKVHRQVAASKEEMSRDARKKFYLYDPEGDLIKQNAKIKLKKDADKEYIKISADADKMKRVLWVMTKQNPAQLNELEIENKLYALKDSEPAQFLKISLDKNLDVKAEIEELIEASVLRKIGNQIIYGDETIGENMSDTVVYFKNKKNSGAINSMRAQLKTIA
mgnify:CR=1 FL=1|tara:strand:+ start:105 stop:908 length:804 start_codon:yes stop_codon:yes gene_type:complete